MTNNEKIEEIAKEIVGKWGYEEPYWWKPIADAITESQAPLLKEIELLKADNDLHKEHIEASEKDAKESYRVYKTQHEISNNLQSELAEAKEEIEKAKEEIENNEKIKKVLHKEIERHKAEKDEVVREIFANIIDEIHKVRNDGDSKLIPAIYNDDGTVDIEGKGLLLFLEQIKQKYLKEGGKYGIDTRWK